ncbi:MAG: ferrous iron transport protein B [Bacteroidales bacterium]
MEEFPHFTLSDLATGETAVITRITGQGAFRKRITEMGFVRGKKIRVIRNAPLQDPIEYSLMGYHVSLRRSEAALIEVGVVNAPGSLPSYQGSLLEEGEQSLLATPRKGIRIALVGNPNSGKTTLFNHASGSHERVGNYGGVTVEAKEALIRHGKHSIRIFDLPGTYSVTEYTPEELFVRNHLLQEQPDLVVNVVDASNLERNLYLTTQLIDMNLRVVIALNMYDELEQQGVRLAHQQLGKLLGIPVVPMVAVKGKGMNELLQTITEVYEQANPVVRHIHIHYGISAEQSVRRLQALIRKHRKESEKISTRYLAIRLLEKDATVKELLGARENLEDILQAAQQECLRLEKESGEPSTTLMADARYAFIAGALKETCHYPGETGVRKKDPDRILTHRYLGFPVFIFFMWLMFQTTFTLGGIPMNWIDAGMGWLGSFTGSLLPAGALHDLMVDGIIGGVGGVIVFLPNILILFFFISLMEDTGYMARVSFIMDRLMHRIGLHGKSFIPLLMGFGCNVPAVMATRTLENRKDRILTMLITPFMSCSARLPVYVLIISAFFPRYQGLVLFSVYIAGIALAVLVALVLKKTVFRKQDVPFVMELPPYRIPTARNTIRHMWYKGSQYLRKMGSVILLASILIWALSYYPRQEKQAAETAEMISQVEKNPSLNDEQKSQQIGNLQLELASVQQENSYLGRLGHFIEPAIEPLGFDWKIGISILTGLAAKEIVVSSMGVLYHAGLEQDESSGSLIEKLQQQEHTAGPKAGEKVFTPLVAFGFMLFILIYFPCVAVIAAINKESNRGWAVFTMVYTTALAWLVAFVTYQLGSLLL